MNSHCKYAYHSLHDASQLNPFYRAMLCIRGTSHGPVSVCVCVCLSVSVCHKSEFYYNG